MPGEVFALVNAREEEVPGLSLIKEWGLDGGYPALIQQMRDTEKFTFRMMPEAIGSLAPECRHTCQSSSAKNDRDAIRSDHLEIKTPSERRVSPHTRELYRSSLLRFQRYVFFLKTFSFSSPAFFASSHIRHPGTASTVSQRTLPDRPFRCDRVRTAWGGATTRGRGVEYNRTAHRHIFRDSQGRLGKVRG